MKAIIHPRIALLWTDEILALDLSEAPVVTPRHPVVTTEAIPADAPPSSLNGLPDHRSSAALDARRRRGDICVVARQGNRIVGFAWLARGPWVLRDAGLEFLIDASTEAIVYDFFTAAEFRGQGIMQQVIRRVADVARAQGRRRLYARAERGNLGSIVAMERVSFVRLASITTLRALAFTGFHLIDIADEHDPFYQHARRHLHATRPGILRWRCQGRSGVRFHLCGHARG
jgi:GNAT superfamily N-acetyltransferase